jgi:hypothetical protein
MARPKGPQSDPTRSALYEQVALSPTERVFRPGKTDEDRIPRRRILDRPRVRRALLSLAPGPQRVDYAIRVLGVAEVLPSTENWALIYEMPQRRFPTITHPGVIRQ